MARTLVGIITLRAAGRSGGRCAPFDRRRDEGFKKRRERKWRYLQRGSSLVAPHVVQFQPFLDPRVLGPVVIRDTAALVVENELREGPRGAVSPLLPDQFLHLLDKPLYPRLVVSRFVVAVLLPLRGRVGFVWSLVDTLRDVFARLFDRLHFARFRDIHGWPGFGALALAEVEAHQHVRFTLLARHVVVATRRRVRPLLLGRVLDHDPRLFVLLGVGVQVAEVKGRVILRFSVRSNKRNGSVKSRIGGYLANNENESCFLWWDKNFTLKRFYTNIREYYRLQLWESSRADDETISRSNEIRIRIIIRTIVRWIYCPNKAGRVIKCR